MNQEAILSTMWIGYGTDGIVRIRILKDAVITTDNMRVVYATIERMAGTKNWLLLVDAREKFDAGDGVMDYARSKSGYRLATAILTNNSFSKAILNTYITVFKPESAYKMFTNEKEAEDWLMARKPST
jgi:hypothetical protein